ncbi:MAG: hypothetical protein LBG59_05155 [Candidatus Peribacteria bacterium]|jgi:hypothetical protein|nr:hypothetical protein [Candidatus Peribacteria bacterium]
MRPPLLVLFCPPKRKLALPDPIAFPDPPPKKALGVVPVITFAIHHKIIPLGAKVVFPFPHKINVLSPCVAFSLPPPIKLVVFPVFVVPTAIVPDTIKTPERLLLA